MKVRKFFLRCYGERVDSQWVVVCLDFCLAAQADTFNEARELLDAQIRTYLREALVGQDREHAEVLLSRRAPLGMWLKYYYMQAWSKLHRALGGTDKVEKTHPFRETIPMVPAQC